MANLGIFDAMIPDTTVTAPFKYASPDDRLFVMAVVDNLKNDIHERHQIELFKKFNRPGIETKFKSWISRENNLPISSKEIAATLGRDYIRGLTTKTKLAEDVVSDKLAMYVPKIVAELSPMGELPSDDVLPLMIDSLLGKL